MKGGYSRSSIPTGWLPSACRPMRASAGGRSSEVLTPRFVTDMRLNDTQMTRLAMVSGEEAYVSLHDLVPFPGSLLVIQRRADVMRAWLESVEQVSLLFSVTFLVLMLLGGAFHWQAAKAAEADRTLSTATERLDMALDRGHCGLWDWDVAHGKIFWSKSMYAILGTQEKGEFLSFGEVAERIHPDDAPLEGVVEELLRGERASLDQEFRIRHTDGHWVWLRIRAALSRAPGEAAPHLIGIAIDVTAQKLADRLNQEAELRLKDAIENISEAFVLWNPNNELVLCNSKYQQFHSLPASVCVPGTPYEVVAQDRQGAGDPPAHATPEPGSRRRQHIRGAIGRQPLAAYQRAADQGWRLRFGRHRHHGAQEARGAPGALRTRIDDDGARPAKGAHPRRTAVAAARRSRRQICPRKDPRRSGQPLEVGIPRQYEP